MASRLAKRTSLEVQALVEAHLDEHMARGKKQDGLVKDRGRSALSSTRCFPAVLVLADRVRYRLMKQSPAFACALSVSVQLILDWSFENVEPRRQQRLRGWHWNFGWQEKLA